MEMKRKAMKRMGCMLLSVMMILTIVPALGVTAAAANDAPAQKSVTIDFGNEQDRALFEITHDPNAYNVSSLSGTKGVITVQGKDDGYADLGYPGLLYDYDYLQILGQDTVFSFVIDSKYKIDGIDFVLAEVEGGHYFGTSYLNSGLAQTVTDGVHNDLTVCFAPETAFSTVSFDASELIETYAPTAEGTRSQSVELRCMRYDLSYPASYDMVRFSRVIIRYSDYGVYDEVTHIEDNSLTGNSITQNGITVTGNLTTNETYYKLYEYDSSNTIKISSSQGRITKIIAYANSSRVDSGRFGLSEEISEGLRWLIRRSGVIEHEGVTVKINGTLNSNGTWSYTKSTTTIRITETYIIPDDVAAYSVEFVGVTADGTAGTHFFNPSNSMTDAFTVYTKHEHTYSATPVADGNKIKIPYTCTCGITQTTPAEEVYLIVPTADIPYTGLPVKAGLSADSIGIHALNESNISYEQQNGAGWDAMSDAPVTPGTYRATLTVAGVSVTTDPYTIVKGTPSPYSFTSSGLVSGSKGEGSYVSDTYSGTAATVPTVTCRAEGLGAISVHLYDKDGKQVDDSAVDAGEYKIRITAEAGDYFNAVTEEMELPYVFKIMPKVASLEWQKSKAEDAENGIDLVYTGSPLQMTAVVSNALEGDTVNLIYTGDAEKTNAGTYHVTASGLDNPNYTLMGTPAAQLTHEWKIEKANAAVGPEDITVYQGENADIELDLSGLLSGQRDFTGTPVFAITDSNHEEVAFDEALRYPGTYTITWANPGDITFTSENYNVAAITEAKLIVNAVPVKTYPIGRISASNGTISLSHNAAAQDKVVTITVAPDSGYELDRIIVKDETGKVIAVTEQKAGSVYTFVMPSSQVTVEASFREESSEIRFTDVNESDFFYNAVIWAVENGITDGIGENKFGPGIECSRAQILTFLYRAAGEPDVGTPDLYSDIETGSYYEKAFAWAIEKNLIYGIGEGRFAPDMPCSRAQIVTLLARFSNVEGTFQNPFVDIPEGSYYENAVGWAFENMLAVGVGDNRFAPEKACTRGEIVTLLYRYFAK